MRQPITDALLRMRGGDPVAKLHHYFAGVQVMTHRKLIAEKITQRV
jgi:hypothetical protein